MAEWQQVGHGWVKVLADKTLVCRLRYRGWTYSIAECGKWTDSTFVGRTAENAMSAADAIYDPPKKQIEAKERGPSWSFWVSEDRSKWAIASDDNESGLWIVVRSHSDDQCWREQADAEAAARKYVGGE